MQWRQTISNKYLIYDILPKTIGLKIGGDLWFGRVSLNRALTLFNPRSLSMLLLITVDRKQIGNTNNKTKNALPFILRN